MYAPLPTTCDDEGRGRLSQRRPTMRLPCHSRML